MSGQKNVYVCEACGYRSPRWQGRCPGCRAWNTLVETRETVKTAGRGALSSEGASFAWQAETAAAMPISEVSAEQAPRLVTGIAEFDRVLGGGVVRGSLVLLGGDPGIGKSTLLMQVLQRLVATAGPCLYVSGEESLRQVRLRAERLGTLSDRLYVMAEVDLAAIEAAIVRLQPAAVVIDSIQTMRHPDLESAPGSVAQVRECAAHLLRLAKSLGCAVFLIGHVTKGGELAGPRTLEHAVDTVLTFEGERHYAYRIVRAVKNRFGPAGEVGLFEMAGDGLREVPNPSAVFLAERPEQASGSVIVASIEGTRPLLVELQALVVPSPYGQPRRTTSGVDPNRVAFIVAVLERRCGLAIGGHDIYVKTAGGLRIDEPAADLGIAVALASSFLNRQVSPHVVVFGEVGLSGEVRSVHRMPDRLREAARLGLRQCVLPQARGKETDSRGDATVKDAAATGLQLLPVMSVRAALDAALL